MESEEERERGVCEGKRVRVKVGRTRYLDSAVDMASVTIQLIKIQPKGCERGDIF
eukprot:COSAG03_NODE_17848_length_366_cov_12.715356_1_plen_54_part_10